MDTLTASQKLKEAGLSQQQAETISLVVDDLGRKDLLTRTELRHELEPIRTDIAIMKNEIGLIRWLLGGIGFGIIILVIKSFVG